RRAGPSSGRASRLTHVDRGILGLVGWASVVGDPLRAGPRLHPGDRLHPSRVGAGGRAGAAGDAMGAHDAGPRLRRHRSAAGDLPCQLLLWHRRGDSTGWAATLGVASPTVPVDPARRPAGRPARRLPHGEPPPLHREELSGIDRLVWAEWPRVLHHYYVVAEASQPVAGRDPVMSWRSRATPPEGQPPNPS